MSEYKLGIDINANIPMELVDQLDIIKNVGFEAFFTMWTPDKTEEIANKAARLGLFQQSIHSPFSSAYKVSHLWNEGEEGVRVTNALIDCVNDCARFDIPIMVIHPFIGFKDHTPTRIGLDNYTRVAEAASRLGVKLAFENVEGEEYLAALMEHFKGESCVGFCFDTGHEMCYNRHKDMLALYGDRLIHTHLNDNLGVRGEEITFHDDLHLMPTHGIANWHGIMERIRRTGYSDVLMSELSFSEKEGKNGLVHKYSELGVEGYFAQAFELINKAVSM